MSAPLSLQLGAELAKIGATVEERAAFEEICCPSGDDMPGSVRGAPPAYLRAVAEAHGVRVDRLLALEALVDRRIPDLLRLLEGRGPLRFEARDDELCRVVFRRVAGVRTAARPRERRARRAGSSAARGDPARDSDPDRLAGAGRRGRGAR